MEGNMIIDKIKEVLAEQLGIDAKSIKDDANILEDLEADSLDIIEMLMALEDEYGVTIPDDQINKVKTVQEVANLLVQKSQPRERLAPALEKGKAGHRVQGERNSWRCTSDYPLFDSGRRSALHLHLRQIRDGQRAHRLPERHLKGTGQLTTVHPPFPLCEQGTSC